MVAPALPAFHNPAEPLISTTPMAAGGGWAATTVTFSGNGLLWGEIQGDLSAGTEMYSLGVWLLNSNNQLMGAFVATGWGGGTELHIQTIDPVGTLIDIRGGSLAGLGGAAGGFGLPAGTYTVVLVGAIAGGTFSNGAFNIYASGSTVSASTSGSDAFLHRDPDFEGLANVFLNPAATVRAKVIVDASVTQTVEGRLFGLFQALSGNVFVSTAVISYQGPSTSGSLSSIYFMHGEPSGDYTFNIDLNVDATGLVAPAIWVMGAGVNLPGDDGR